MKHTLIILLTCLATLCYGQSYRIFTADQGLSSSLINAIHQDRNGMVWIATEDGLNRYDGVRLTVYRNRPGDSRSLASNYVRTLFEDREGHLIIGTYAGLQLYDPATDTFSTLATDENGHVFRSNINNIVQRRNGDIWVAGNTACRLVVAGDRLSVESLQLPMPTTSVGYIMEDRASNIWISREEDGLYRMDVRKRVKHYPITAQQPCLSILCEDARGTIYGGSARNGVFQWDKATDRFVPLLDDNRQDFPVKTLYSASPDELYIGSDGCGLKIYNSKTHCLSDYQFEEVLFDSRKSKVHAIQRDRSGNCWVAIYQKGVVLIPSKGNGFKYWGCRSVSKNIIGSNCITAIYRDHTGTCYVGTDNDGLYVIGSDGRQLAHYAHNGDPHAVPSIIPALFEDASGNLWIGSYANGAAQMNRKTGKCTYLQGLVDKSGAPVRNVYAFAEDNMKRLWIATMGGGLFCHNQTTHTMVSINNMGFRFEEYWICCLHYSPKKNCLYAGTYNGLYRIDLGKANRPIRCATKDCIVYAICETQDGTVWAGTSTGLFQWDERRGKSRFYTTDDGLSNNYAYAVNGDAHGCLWVSTSNGLSRFHLATQQFTNYYVGDGLQGNEFSKNATWCDGQGTLWFGGVNGITYFNPTDIVPTNRKRHVRITNFYLYGQPVRGGMKSGGVDIIDGPVFEAQTFRLAHQDNSFSIECSTLETDNADKVVYTYSMNGEKWTALPQGTNLVFFNNLSPGTYHFAFKAIDGGVESDAKTIIVYIARPWWDSGWAWCCYVLALLAVAVFIARQIRRRYRVRQEMQRHIHAEQLNEAKLQYFINVSHEIRTPMTLIISPLQQLMTSDTDSKRQQVYRTIYRNAERILRLVNQLMDIRKIDKGQMHLTFRETDIVAFIEDLFRTFVALAEKKHIRFTFRHDGLERLPLWVDTTHFDKVILNVLSNAFKFTPEGGSVDLTLQIREYPETATPLQHCAEIVVTDSGVGIDPTELERIFDRFYQTRNATGNNYRGTGIGLHLTRQLVRLHHGTIHAENLPSGAPGSRFVIRLPLGNAHLRPEEMDCGQVARTTSEQSVAAADASQPEAEDLSKATHPRQRRRLLIVEDDEEIRQYLRQELAADYYVTESQNGKDALAAVFAQAPDLIISDVMMPEMDGFTLCRKIKQNITLNHIPVILLTAKAREEDHIEGLDTGVDAYIAKPFNIEFLRHTVDNLLRSREQLRNIYSGGQQTGEEKLEKIDAKSPDDRLMERIMRVVNANIGNPELSVEMLASEVGLSRVHLHRKLKELTNQTTRDFIRNVRLKQAATLLAEKRHAVSEVATLVGFTNMGNFSTAFKERYGVTPMVFREGQNRTEKTPPSQ